DIDGRRNRKATRPSRAQWARAAASRAPSSACTDERRRDGYVQASRCLYLEGSRPASAPRAARDCAPTRNKTARERVHDDDGWTANPERRWTTCNYSGGTVTTPAELTARGSAHMVSPPGKRGSGMSDSSGRGYTRTAIALHWLAALLIVCN